MSSDTTDRKAAATARARLKLQDFLEANSILYLPRPRTPRLSILLVLHNRAELTLNCLRSLQPRLAEAEAEIVFVDNASRDETPDLLERIRGATVLRNDENRGFPEAVNQAAAAAAGQFLLLLNNDTEIEGDSLTAAMRFLTANPDAGAVGGRIILLDGTLQEAGCVIWREGHVLQYGRGDSPTAAEYLFQRDVDYCSAAFLMTPRTLFKEIGGLDTSFSPGYFEDLDYCVRLWRGGRRVVYLPDVALLHYENASSTCRQDVLRLYRRNHVLFTYKHAEWLPWQRPAATTPALWARSSHDDRFKILYLPRRRHGRGAELRWMVGDLQARHCFVTVYPIGGETSAGEREADGLPRDVELLSGGTLDALPGFLAERRHYYDSVLAGDAEILARLRQCG